VIPQSLLQKIYLFQKVYNVPPTQFYNWKDLMFAPSKIVNSTEPLEAPQPRQSNSYLLHGIIASMLLMAIYFSIVSIAESLNHAVVEFISLSYLMVPVIISFGIQIALFSYSRQQSKVIRQRSTSATTNGGMSTASMIACCAHHLTDVAALIGLAAVTLFLTTYQTAFILIGLISNIIGILTSLIFIQKNKLYRSQGFFAKTMQLNLNKARKIAVIFGVIIVIAAFASIAIANQPAASNNLNGNNVSTAAPSTTPINSNIALTAKNISQNGLTIVATPQSFTYGDKVQIALSLDAHSEDLSFDLTKVSTLEDSNGTTYAPIEWRGNPPGGHHISGTLTFPTLNGEPSFITLILKNVYGLSWDFKWTITT